MVDSKAVKSTKELLAEVVASSGFPFQAKIQAVIESREDWKVLGTEVPWRFEGEENFLDVVACQDNLFLAIECKKVAALQHSQNKYGREWPSGTPRTNYIFLRRETNADTANVTTRAIVTYCPDEDESDREPWLVFGAQPQEWNLMPASVEASLCVTVDLEDPRALIEREVANLVRGCHEYAGAVYIDASNHGAPTNEIFIPVLVTTAHLFAARFNPDEVDIATGDYQLDPKEIEPVPWVRFKKAFMAGGAEHSDVRTVFVVHSAWFERFLNEFGVAKEPSVAASD